MKAEIIKDSDGLEVLSISNRGFHPILLLEYLSKGNGWIPIRVVTGDDTFLISLEPHVRGKKMLRALREFINSNY